MRIDHSELLHQCNDCKNYFVGGKGCKKCGSRDFKTITISSKKRKIFNFCVTCLSSWKEEMEICPTCEEETIQMDEVNIELVKRRRELQKCAAEFTKGLKDGINKNHKENAKEYNKQWMIKHPEEWKARKKKYSQQYRERYKEVIFFKEHPLTVMICKYCGKEYISRFKRIKFCSSECRNKMSYFYQRKRREMPFG